jgi:Zn-dependent metalloprotease
VEILREFFGSDSDFEDRVVPKGKPFHDEAQGRSHLRFIQKINDYIVEGAALVVHIDSNGEVEAVNGEFVEGKGLSTVPVLTSKQALAKAIHVQYKGHAIMPEVVGSAVLTVVRASRDGSACFAWKAPVQYEEEEEVVTVNKHATKRKLVRQDYVFANAENGEPCAIHPQVFGGFGGSLDDGNSHEEADVEIPSLRRLVGDTPGTPKLETYNCQEKTDYNSCILVGNAGSSGDLAVDSAHDYANATYHYYWDSFTRDSIDDLGMVSIAFPTTVLLCLPLVCCLDVLILMLLSYFRLFSYRH